MYSIEYLNLYKSLRSFCKLLKQPSLFKFIFIKLAKDTKWIVKKTRIRRKAKLSKNDWTWFRASGEAIGLVFGPWYLVSQLGPFVRFFHFPLHNFSFLVIVIN